MTYLVTGGRGFIGSYVVRDLVRQGERVIVHDFFTDDGLWATVLTPEERRESTIVNSSSYDFAELARLIVDHRVTHLIHMVSMLHPASNENPVWAEKVNNLSFANALEATRLWQLRLVWASSVVVFGPRQYHPQEAVPNDAPHHPTTVYAACKSFNEFLANHYHQAWGVDHIGLRFTLVYGPGRTRGASSFVMRLMKEPALGQPTIVPFAEDEVDWQYVEDISRLVITCTKIDSPETRIFNTHCDVRRVREAGQYVKTLLPDAQISYEPGVFGAAWKLDDAALRGEIGFEWHYRMEAGIKKTINFYRTRAGLSPVGE